MRKVGAGTGGRSRCRMVAAVVLLSAALALSACGPYQAVGMPGATDPEYSLAIDRGRNIVSPLVRRGSGVAVAVGVDGELVWSEGFGYTSLEEEEPVRPDMPFRVYSVMKQITAVLALQSAVRGEVDMGSSVREALPGLPEAYGPVTLQQLLTHTAGVRHYHDPAEAAMTEHCATAVDALPRFIDDPLVSTPGAEESYSTWGFVLASAVLEAATDETFSSLIEGRIFEPAGMESTHLEGEDGPPPPAYYDVGRNGDVSVSPAIDNSCKMGGGGFLASAADIVRFHNAVLRGELVPLPAVRQMLGDRTALVAGGSGPGGHAVSTVDLETGISVVVVSNTSGLEQEMALERARDLLTEIFAADG